jgi:pyruvate/2-oxoacid:ferredoxin oxidoreductase alpha subunit
MGEIDKKPSSDYLRYSLKTKTGVSPIAFPGTAKGEYLCNSYEHDEGGFSTESPELSKQMMEKRMAKLSGILKELPRANDKLNKKLCSQIYLKIPFLKAMLPEDNALIFQCVFSLLIN